MRALILVAGAALTISACGDDRPAEKVTNVDGDLSARTISANDTTSIDAATGEDANMAADVNFTVNEADKPAGEAKADDERGGKAEAGNSN
ncbi:MAG TPA: hypothetical protein VFK58_05290 [Sphingomicrobium sp.]|nr:hypothetical protein [Sphingomicrobium sp.]